jgi:hypothetical protein
LPHCTPATEVADTPACCVACRIAAAVHGGPAGTVEGAAVTGTAVLVVVEAGAVVAVALRAAAGVDVAS